MLSNSSKAQIGRLSSFDLLLCAAQSTRDVTIRVDHQGQGDNDPTKQVKSISASVNQTHKIRNVHDIHKLGARKKGQSVLITITFIYESVLTTR
jgi:hypothetical protein